MPCIGRRGFTERFRGRVSDSQLLAILMHHGSCGGFGLDTTDNPRFREPEPGTKGIAVPYCPACFEERWPVGAPGPFERGQPQIYPGQD